MDLSQAGGSAIQDYGSALTNLQNQDAQTRQFINNRNDLYLRSTQQAPNETQQTAAQGTPDAATGLQTPAPGVPDTPASNQGVTAPAPAVKPAKPVISQPYNPNQTPNQSDAETRRLANIIPPSAQGPNWVTTGPDGQQYPSSDADSFARLQALRALNPVSAGVNTNVTPPAAATDINAFNAGKKALQPKWNPGPQTDMTGVKPPSASPAPAAGSVQSQLQDNGAPSGPMTPERVQAAVSRTQDEIDAITREMQRPQQNKDATGILQAALDKAHATLQTLKAGGANVMTAMAPGSNAQAAEVPPQQSQGPKFTSANGTQFTIPQPYSDGQIQQMQQQAIQAKNALQLEWLRYQNGTSPDNSKVQQAQARVQQLNQGLYDADIYAKTQQAQAGNPQAFSALLNEYSNKVGQPIQVVPEGNGMYSLRAKGGQVIAHGDPSALAGTLGGVLNSGARAYNLHLQQMEAESGATERGKANAMLPTELAKLQNALRQTLSTNDTTLLKQALENNKPTTVQLTGGQVVYVDPSNKASPVSVIDPNKPTKTNGASVQRPILPQ